MFIIGTLPKNETRRPADRVESAAVAGLHKGKARLQYGEVR